ncbi:DNA invertase Pin-like site-specific DNA recombinase [Arthrobacter oryzae]|nr:recombinase family protein [Arthrobacter oryzae]MDR6508084.1 DNA invertase Pin-like site-specific DNA recombinase [Arthrobacter oryzae]
MSGTKAGRPGLTKALEALLEGDTLIVWKLDRLGRSVKDLLDFAGGLNKRCIGFVSLTDSIDTTTASGRFFFNVMASLAQMERELMVERTQAGVQAAREQSRAGGRKRVMTEAKFRSARSSSTMERRPRKLPPASGYRCPYCTAGYRPRPLKQMQPHSSAFGADDF